MAQAPKVIVQQDSSAAGALALAPTDKVVILAETRDGPSLNADGKLIFIGGIEDVYQKLGRNLASSPVLDMLASKFDIDQTPFYVGRVTGATSGVKAQTAVIVDIQGSPGNSIRATWWGMGADGNLYSLKVSRGRLSTSDTGAGRVDTKLELIETASGKVIASLDNLVMDTSKANYAVDSWNALGTLCTLADQTPSDTYEIADEPAVGTYAFSSGADPVAATTTERQAAADKLALVAELDFALIGVQSWPAADVNYLAGKAATPLWTIIAHLADGTTSSAAATFEAAITSSRDRVALHAGWGKNLRNPKKRIPGLGQVLAQAVLGSRTPQGRSANLTGANQAIDRWIEFDTYTQSELEAFAAARTNPMYRVANNYQTGVIVADVLSLSKEPRYSQWGSRRGDDQILYDIVSYLNNRVKLSKNFPFGLKVSGINAPISLDSLSRIDGDIVRLMAEYPVSLLSGGRGTGWDWAGDIVNGVDGPEPVFKLGTDVAKVGRILTVLIGEVQGRFTVQSVEEAA